MHVSAWLVTWLAGIPVGAFLSGVIDAAPDESSEDSAAVIWVACLICWIPLTAAVVLWLLIYALGRAGYFIAHRPATDDTETT